MNATVTFPFQLVPLFRERVWGKTSLTPFFSREQALGESPDTIRIGEVWYTFTENRTSAGKNLGEILQRHPEVLGNAADPEYPGVCPILVKLLFTTERLSVQVHPDDTYAGKHHGSLGKTEAWYVLAAEDPGEVAIGFRQPITPGQFQAGIVSGAIEQQLDWRKVEAGDTIFVPAGTVHAIGAGLTVCEVQENSDITYRLYDYGRPRELHVEHGTAVSQLMPHTHQASPAPLSEGRDELTACEYFRMERLRPRQGFSLQSPLPFYAILICTRGEGTLNGTRTRAGEAWFLPAHTLPVDVEASGSEWILAYRAASPAPGVSVQ